MLSTFSSDQNSDKLYYADYGLKKLLKINFTLPFPKSTLLQITAQLYNPVFIHQWNEKWFRGRGLSIFRNLAKYFIFFFNSILKKNLFSLNQIKKY